MSSDSDRTNGRKSLFGTDHDLPDVIDDDPTTYPRYFAYEQKPNLKSHKLSFGTTEEEYLDPQVIYRLAEVSQPSFQDCPDPNTSSKFTITDKGIFVVPRKYDHEQSVELFKNGIMSDWARKTCNSLSSV